MRRPVPPGWLLRLLRAVLPSGPVGASILGDLLGEFGTRSRDGDPAAARRWLVAQGLGVAGWAVLDRLRGRAWGRRGGPHDRRALGTAGAARPGDGGLRPRLAGLGQGCWACSRSLARSPGYSAAVVATLAVALGSTLTILAVVRGVLLRDLPFPDADRVVRIDRIWEGQPLDGGVSYPDYIDWKGAATSFAALAFWQGNEGTYVRDGVAEVWNGVGTTVELFDVVGVAPALGTIPTSEWLPGAELIALSTSTWRSRFGADPAILGRTIEFHGRTRRVVAVMPPDFSFPDATTDYWLPLIESPYLERRGAGTGKVAGRIGPDRTTAVALGEVIALASRVDAELARDTEGVTLRSVQEVEAEPVRRLLWIIMGAVLAVLLVAAANVAGLALARVESRRSELSLRRSLGAGRLRVAGMLLGEQVLLALAGGAFGAGAAWAAVPWIVAMDPGDLPRPEAIHLDPFVILVGTGLAVASGVLSGLLPALRGARTGVGVVDSTARGGSVSRRHRRVHAGLTVLQIAGAVVLLSAAGLVANSFIRLTSVAPGFRLDDVLTVEVGLPSGRYDTEDVLVFQRTLFDVIAGLPGVVHVGSSTHLPFSSDRVNVTTTPEGEVARDGADRLLSLEVVNGEYMAAIGLDPILGGALPVRPGGPLRVAVINETAARTFFGEADAVGRAFSFETVEGALPSPESLIRVVGVVPDVRRGALDEPAAPTAYFAVEDFHRYYTFITGRFSYLTVRVEGGDPYTVLPGLRAAVSALDPALPFLSVATMRERVRDSLMDERFRTFLLGAFGLMAVMLALLGVYGVTSFGVRASIRDVGVRMALGAGGHRVRHEILVSTARTAIGGVVLGLATARLLGPALSGLLFEIEGRDPPTLFAASTLVGAACMLAAWLPATRASRVDPAGVLRGE